MLLSGREMRPTAKRRCKKARERERDTRPNETTVARARREWAWRARRKAEKRSEKRR